MSNVTLAPVIAGAFDEPVSAGRARSAAGATRLRGILSGLVFLAGRVPVYVAAGLFAAVVCVVGIALAAVHAGLGGRHV